MDAGGANKVALNGPLVEKAQATLARMRVSERAYTLLKSEAHNEGIEDWVASQRGGPDMALVFQAANGASLDTVRVPGFLTYEGFYAALLDRMPTIADKLQKDNWVLGASGDQGAVKQQYASLFPDILSLYGRDFLSAWTAALANLQLRPLLKDKPKYLTLSAASAPTSPILQIFQSVRDETALTRERPKPPQPGGAAADQAKQDLARAASSRLGYAGREAIDLAMKSQRKAGDPPPEVPGASIEANFKPIQILVDGEPGSRPIDALLANLNELYRQLVLAAENPAQAKQALEQVEVQVASLQVECDKASPAARRMDGQGRQGRRRRRQHEFDRANFRIDGPGRHRPVPADRQRPLSVRQDRPRRAAGGFRQDIRARRRNRPVLFDQSRAAGQPERQDLDLETQPEPDPQAVGCDAA